MRQKVKHSPLGTMTFILTAGIFFIIVTVTTLQSILMYLYWRIVFNADIPIPEFWHPFPLIAVLSAVVGTILAFFLSHIRLKPVCELIEAINQLADGNFEVRVHLDLNPEFMHLSDSFNRMAQELENTELLRSDFINNFSHEFKTPIVSLRGFAKMLKNDRLSTEQRNEYLDIIINESTRLAQLSSNMLNLSKIEKMNILSDMQVFNLSEKIRQSILLLESKWQKKELQLIIEIDELTYYGNEDLLNQVWINLIDNAIKFSSQNGKIKLKLFFKDPHVIFQVIDNGCGMNEETKQHIFDRFYQGDRSHSVEGNGIGLTVAERIVHLHGGGLLVRSEAGIGTTFTVFLPVTPS